MDDVQVRKDVRQQVATVMQRAAIILGSEKALAARLGCSETELRAWMLQTEDCPSDSVSDAADVILAYLRWIGGRSRAAKRLRAGLEPKPGSA